MGKNEALNRAKKRKNDEFYTRIEDIEKELSRYTFTGKRVLSCFDTRESGFSQFFEQRFSDLGMAGYTRMGINKGMLEIRQLSRSLWGPPICEFLCMEDTDGQGTFSDDGMALIDWADVVVTNPPFSRFRELLDILIAKGKKFVLVGSASMLTVKSVFDAITGGVMWRGQTRPKGFYTPDGRVVHIGGACWFTNMGAPIEEYCAFSKWFSAGAYNRYSNFDAIDVPRLKDIPRDYFGVMGVPSTVLEKYVYSDHTDDGGFLPQEGKLGDWFDILGLAPGCLDSNIVYGEKFYRDYTGAGGRANISVGMKGLALYDGGKAVLPYKRVLIQRKYGREHGRGDTGLCT